MDCAIEDGGMTVTVKAGNATIYQNGVPILTLPIVELQRLADEAGRQ